MLCSESKGKGKLQCFLTCKTEAFSAPFPLPKIDCKGSY